MDIVVAEALALAREGLALLLSRWPHGQVHQAATAEDAARLLERRAAILVIDDALLGPDREAALRRLRGVVSGVGGGVGIGGEARSARIIVLAGGECRDSVLACLAAGAHGYVARSAGFAELARAVEVMRDGGVHVPASLATPGAAPGATPGNVAPLPAPVLTGRQQDVLRLLAEGRSTKDIARTLDLAVSTIKVHLAAVYRTFGARNRVEALCRAGRLPPLSHAA